MYSSLLLKTERITYWQSHIIFLFEFDPFFLMRTEDENSSRRAQLFDHQGFLHGYTARRFVQIILKPTLSNLLSPQWGARSKNTSTASRYSFSDLPQPGYPALVLAKSQKNVERFISCVNLIFP